MLSQCSILTDGIGVLLCKNKLFVFVVRFQQEKGLAYSKGKFCILSICCCDKHKKLSSSNKMLLCQFPESLESSVVR